LHELERIVVDVTEELDVRFHPPVVPIWLEEFMLEEELYERYMSVMTRKASQRGERTGGRMGKRWGRGVGEDYRDSRRNCSDTCCDI
jgi:hypothetical protein